MPSRNRQHSKSRREFKESKLAASENVASDMKVVADIKPNKAWCPSTYTAFKVLLSARLCAAVWSNISDCDEVFNYWEPMHYLLYGEGFQTWEYSPLYAIRSYAYLWLHAIPSFVYGSFLQSNKVLVFYFLRCVLAFCSALSDVYFYKSVCHHFGANVGRLMLLFLTVGTGMFISSTAFLPSSFSMYISTIAAASWFLQKYEIAIFATAVSTLVGWPFVVILGLPILFDVVFIRKKALLFLKSSVVSLFLIMVPLIMVDSKHFGKLVIAPLNIVLYNVFTSHGPDLYGTEPCSFYLLNGVLNFNIVFILAILAIPILALFSKHQTMSSSPPYILCLLPLYLWMIVFFPLAHKEERFLFPIYPMICLAGASTIDSLQKIYHHIFSRKSYSQIDVTDWFSIIICVTYILLCVSRTVITYKGYRAPIETYMELGRFSSDEQLHPLPPEYPVNLCVGKEWYRFPSSFFLPENWKLRFLQSEFRGQLPKPFSNLPNATKIIPSDMNDLNLEEKSRYIDIKYCDYIIDSDYPRHAVLEPRYSYDKNWNITFSLPFLDIQRSHRFLRSFYVPYLTDFRCVYINYNLLQRVTIKDRLRRKRKQKIKQGKTL